MPETLYYTRSRGKTRGPFRLDQLIAAKERRTLGRSTQVSTDRVNWFPADTMTELYAPQPVTAPETPPRPEPDPGGSFQAMEEDPTPIWNYQQDGAEHGPVPTSVIRTKITRGKLTGNEHVWRAGWPEWKKLRETEEFGSLISTTGGRTGTGRSVMLWGAVILGLGVVAGAGYAGYLFITQSPSAIAAVGKTDSPPDSDPLLITDISGFEAEEKVAQAVGMVVCGYRITSVDGHRVEWIEFPFVGSEGYFTYLDDGESKLNTIAGSLGTAFSVTSDGYMLTNQHVIEEADRRMNSPETLQLMKDGFNQFLMPSDSYLSQVIDRIGTDRYREQRRLWNTVKRMMPFREVSKIEPAVWVILAGDPYLAEIVHISADFDHAILKVDREDCPYFPLSAAKRVPRGMSVTAFGFPSVSRSEIGRGKEIKKGVDQLFQSTHIHHWFRESEFEYDQTSGTATRVVERDGLGLLLQHNADINKGNSGGPLVSENGVVQGLNTWSKQYSTTSSGVHFAVMTKQLKREINRHIGEDAVVWVEGEEVPDAEDD